MGFAVWIDRIASGLGGSPRPADPDEFVELVTVADHQGPLTVALLERAGIEAVELPRFDVARRSVALAVIQVRRRDVERSTAVLERAS